MRNDMQIHPIYKSLIKLFIIITAVYLSFSYILPLIFPFLIAVLLVKLSSPLAHFFSDKFRIPDKISGIIAILIVAGSITGIFSLIIVNMCSQFQLFCSNYHKYRQFCSNTISDFMQNIGNQIDYVFKLHNGTCISFMLNKFRHIQNIYIDKLCSNAAPIITKCFSYLTRILIYTFIVFISMLIYNKDRQDIRKQYETSIIYKPMQKILSTLKTTGAAYVRAQLIIIATNWIVCSISFLILHNPYSILIGFIIAAVDALPVLGSGTFFVPIGIYYIITGNYLNAAIMFTAYVITLFIREILEARLLGASMDILPFYILASVYIGLNVFGVSGIILGPFGLILIKTLYKIC